MSSNRSPLRFFLLVFALSVPFWLLGAMTERWSEELPIDLPVSALMAVVPSVSALILVRREGTRGSMRRLLRRAFDCRKIEPKTWYIPIIFLMPVIMLLSYAITRLMGQLLPEPRISFLTIPILLVVFFISGAVEEIGWMGYAVDPMQKRWSALQTGRILGSVWQLWHVIPHIQAGRTPTWIAWQFFFSVAARVLIVWLYNNTEGSVFSAILFHDMMNVAQFLFPDGTRQPPAIAGLITAITAVIVTAIDVRNGPAASTSLASGIGGGAREEGS